MNLSFWVKFYLPCFKMIKSEIYELSLSFDWVLNIVHPSSNPLMDLRIHKLTS